MKEQRGLSGMYFRFQNPENNKWENWVFEDLPEEEQDKILANKDIEFIKSIVKNLANTINEISEYLP